MKKLSILAVLAALSLSGQCLAALEQGWLVNVVDGDTVEVRMAGSEEDSEPERLELIYVDTEKESGAAELLGKCLKGKPVHVEVVDTPEKGDEGTVYAYLWVRPYLLKDIIVTNGTRKKIENLDDDALICCNIVLVREGYSPYVTKYGRSRQYDDGFRSGEIYARDNRLGIWTEPAGRIKYLQLKAEWDTRAEEIEREETRSVRVARHLPEEKPPVGFIGTWTTWFPGTEQKAWECAYRDGTEQGMYTDWYKSGQKKSEKTYELGQLTDKAFNWYENGQMELESCYRNGKLHGKVTQWNDKGGKISELFCANGKWNGPFTAWDDDGNVVEKLFYKNDQVVDEAEFRRTDRIAAGAGLRFEVIWGDDNTFTVKNINENEWTEVMLSLDTEAEGRGSFSVKKTCKPGDSLTVKVTDFRQFTRDEQLTENCKPVELHVNATVDGRQWTKTSRRPAQRQMDSN